MKRARLTMRPQINLADIEKINTAVRKLNDLKMARLRLQTNGRHLGVTMDISGPDALGSIGSTRVMIHRDDASDIIERQLHSCINELDALGVKI